MPAKRKAAKPDKAQRLDDSVEVFLRDLEHPHKDAILSVRELILKCSPEIQEGIKWNSVSFKTSEFFATVNYRYKDGVQVVLHRGAKARKDGVELESRISDPKELLEWRDKDRALLTVGGGKELEGARAAITKIVREWITYV